MEDLKNIARERLRGHMKEALGAFPENVEDLARLYLADPKEILQKPSSTPLVNKLRTVALNEVFEEIAKSGDNLTDAWRSIIEDLIRSCLREKEKRTANNLDPQVQPPVSGAGHSVKPKNMHATILNLFYLILLIIVIALVGVLLARGLIQETTVNVNIEFNVGEIITGLLAGGGVAAAGGAYAFKTIKELVPKSKMG